MKAHTLYKDLERLLGESTLEILKLPSDGLALTVFVWLGDALGEHISELPQNWNSSGPNYYSFKLGEAVELVASKIGSSELVFNVRSGKKSSSCTLSVATYINNSFFTRQDSEDIREMFVSDDSTENLIEVVEKGFSEVVATDKPSVTDATGLEQSDKQSSATNNRRGLQESITRLVGDSPSQDSLRPSPSQDSLRPSPPEPPGPAFSIRERGTPTRRETPPGFEDEYEVLGRHANPGLAIGPPTVGERDLYPSGIGPYPRIEPIIGGHDQSLGPGGPSGSGGMYMGRDHPFFQGARRPNPDNGNGEYPGDLTRPQGARWDPPGPSMGGNGFGFGF